MSDLEKVDTPTLVEQKINALSAEKQAEEDFREKKHKENMENSVAYRRNYYQHLLENEFKMHPEDQYHPDEYEALVSRYNAYFDKIGTLDRVEDMEAVLAVARKKFRKVLPKEKIFKFTITVVFSVIIVGTILAVILAYTI